MGNITSTIDPTGGINATSASRFAGTSFNITADQTIFESNVNFTGDKDINFGTGTKVTYYDAPMFNSATGFIINDNAFLDSSGKLSNVFFPTSMEVESLIASNNITSRNFIISGTGSLTGAEDSSINIGGGITGGNIYTDGAFYGSLTGTTSSINIGGGIIAGGGITGVNFYTSGNGKFDGDLEGNVKGNVDGNLTGSMTGVTSFINIGGGITGSNFYTTENGKFTGDLLGNVEGILTGSVTGGTTSFINIGGGITGSNFYTTENGKFTGNLLGNVEGILTGSMTGGTTSSINIGGEIKGKNIQLNETFTEGGGIKIGQNNWVIAENSQGHLCFYNMEYDNTIPIACIGSGKKDEPRAGKLIPGIA